MGPLPTRKQSRRHRNNRRAHHALTQTHLVRCDNCDEYKPSHQVCPHCGTYKGREVIQVSAEE